MARIESHYLVNCAFLPSGNHLLENIDRIRHISAAMVHGSYDVVCPAQNLAQALPEATLNIVEGAGRSVDEPGVLSAVIDAVDGYAARRV